MARQKRWYPPKIKPTLDELVFKFLSGRYPLGRLKQQFGRKKTNETITHLASTLLLIEPEHEKSLEWLKRMEKNYGYQDR